MGKELPEPSIFEFFYQLKKKKFITPVFFILIISNCEKKLLCTYMNNIPAGSFLYVKLPPIIFVGKVRKT